MDRGDGHADRPKWAGRASHADFKAVFDDAPAPLVVITPHDYEIVAANDAFQRVTLTDASRILGKQIFDVFPATVNAATVDGQRQLRSELDKVSATRRGGALPIIRYDIPNPDAPDGLEPRWWSQVVSPLLDHEGEVAFLISQLEDVTEAIRPRSGVAIDEDQSDTNAILREVNLALVRELEASRRADLRLRRAAEVDAFRVRLADALRRNSEPTHVIREALRLVAEQLDADYAYFAEVDEDSGYYRIDQAYSRGERDSLLGQYPIASYGELSERLRRGETCVLEDIAADESLNDTARRAMLSHGIVSSVSTSLVKGGRWLAILNVHTDAPRSWSDTEVALVIETADRTWAAYERARAEDQLKHNTETFQSMVKNVPFGMYTVDADLKIVQASPTAEQTFGIPDLIGSDLAGSLRAIWQEPFAQSVLESFVHTLATGEPFASRESVQLRADRFATEAYDWRLERITMPDGRHGVVCYYYDLTRQHQLERLLRESRDRQGFLLAFADELQGLGEPDAILDGACRLLGARFEVDRVVVTRVVNDYHQVLASFTSDVPRLTSKRYATSEFGALFDGKAGSSPWIAVDDVRTEPGFTKRDREVCASLHVIALARVPLRTGDPQAGSLTLHQATSRAWSQLEIDLLTETSYRVGAALERARSQRDLHKLNDSLNAQIAARTLELRRSELVRKAIQETLTEASNFRKSVIERLNVAKIRDRSEAKAHLTPRERQILGSMASGKTDETIATELGIARRTVRNHVNNIYAKLNVRSRAQAIVWAQERGILG
ncbi:MAG TPA: GAF domain-containing protein [Trueperaceae bacterium]